MTACKHWTEVECDEEGHTTEHCRAVKKNCACAGCEHVCDYVGEYAPVEKEYSYDK